MSDQIQGRVIESAVGGGRRQRTWRDWCKAAFLLSMVTACGQSSGCSGCASEGEPFPDKDRIHSAIQVRLTEPGISFLEDNLEPILSEAIPDGLDICIPGDGGNLIGINWGYCTEQCDDGSQGCQITIGVGPVDIEPIEPAKIRARLTFDALQAALNVFVDGLIDCRITIDAPGFPVTMELDLSTPDPTRDLTFSISDAEYRLADLNLGLMGGNGFLSPICDILNDIINFPIIGDLIFDLLQTFIDDVVVDLLAGFIDDFTCRTCEDASDCPIEGGVQCEGGRCMQGDRCIPAPLGVEGILGVGDLVGDFFSPGTTAELGYLLTPGSYVQVENGGLSLGVIGGATSERDRCVPVRAQPPTDEPARAEALRGNLTPGGDPYEVGIGITSVFLEHAMWAAFNGGSLCFTVTGAQIEQLNTRFLGVALPNLSRLTRGEAPMAITLSPQEVPIATIGANRVVPDPENEGQYILEDPLLTVQIPELWLDFHAFMEGRWTRVFSLKADVVVPVGLAFSPGNGIIPVLGNLSAALTNLETSNGEILLDDPNRLVGLLPVLIGPILNLAVEGLADPIALPDIIGYQLDLQDGSVTGVENNTMLAVFANLDRAPPEEGEGLSPMAETTAEVLDVHIPATAEFELDGPDTWKKPFVRLAVDAFDGSQDEPAMEVQWRVDGHSWSLFTDAKEMVVRSPAFLLQGRHTIEVRARRVDDYRTLDVSPARVEVIIDSMAPELALIEEDDGVRVEVSDWVSPPEALVLQARVDGGNWLPINDLRLERPEARLEVRATDEAGNVATASLETSEQGLIGRRNPAEAPADEGCGCVVGRAPSQSAHWLLAAPFALLGLWRRRSVRRRSLNALHISLISLVFLACDDETPSRDRGDMGIRDAGPTECSEERPCTLPNLVCVEGRCVAQSCTDNPEICGTVDCGDRKAVCNNVGICECEPFCADGCGEGEYCCFARNACEALPEGACGDMACPPGFELTLTREGEIDPESCAIEDAECDCVRRMPLDPGAIGRFSDLAVVGGVPYVSAYAENFGDLVVGRLSPQGGLVWQWVDGVPEGPVVADPDGPRGGVDEAGPDVGTHTCIASGPGGTLHVGYLDEDQRALKYALGTPAGAGHTWQVQTLDGAGTGRYCSISLDARGVPGIAYRVESIAEGGAFFSEVRYRLARNDTPGEAVDWNPPFILQRREIPGEDPETGSYPEGTGLFTTQARDREGLPVVAWYDRTLGALWTARFTGAGFSEPEMLAGWGHPDEDRNGDMGSNVDLAIDAEGGLHLCFQDGLTDTLRYLAPGLDIDELVDDGIRFNDGGRSYAIHVVGDDCNVRFTADGTVLIAYQDATGHDLLLAERGGGEEGGWIRRILRGDEPEYRGAYGFYTRARIDAGTLWISNYVYRHEEEPPVQSLEVFSEAL